MISDGIWCAFSVLHPSMTPKVGAELISINDIISVKKCNTKFVNKEGLQYPLIIFLEPPTVIYGNLDKRIGLPKEFTLD